MAEVALNFHDEAARVVLRFVIVVVILVILVLWVLNLANGVREELEDRLVESEARAAQYHLDGREKKAGLEEISKRDL